MKQDDLQAKQISLTLMDDLQAKQIQEISLEEIFFDTRLEKLYNACDSIIMGMSATRKIIFWTVP